MSEIQQLRLACTTKIAKLNKFKLSISDDNYLSMLQLLLRDPKWSPTPNQLNVLNEMLLRYRS